MYLLIIIRNWIILKKYTYNKIDTLKHTSAIC